MRRWLSASALQMVRRSPMNLSRIGNRALDMDVSLIVAGRRTGCLRSSQAAQPSFVQRFAFDRAAAQQARLVLGKIGAGVDRATVVPHQEVAQLPDVLVDEFAPLADLVELLQDRVALLRSEE